MVCSPTTLFVDFSVWMIPEIADSLIDSYGNLIEGEPYDCGLTSVPCDSNITKALINSDPTLAFWFDLIVVYVILTASVVLGVVGNVINIVIFSTNNIVSDSTNNLILALSVSDLVNLFCIVLLLASCFVCNLSESLALTLYTIFLPHVANFTRWFSLLSLDFVTVIAIQRAVAVLFPFTISTIFSRRNTNIIIAVLYMLCLGTMIPLNATFTYKWFLHPYFDRYIILGVDYGWGLKTTSQYVTFYFNIRSILNLCFIFTCGFIIAHMLNRQAKSRAALKADTSTIQAPKTSVRETKAIQISQAIFLVTFAIYSLSVTVNISTQVIVEELFKSPYSSVAEYSLLLLIAINSTFNFFLYVKMSDKFRDVLCRCFKYPCKKTDR